MVPKTGQSSSSKGQGGSSTSDDLYNKAHEFVLSRTPDQSQMSVFLHLSMRSAIAAISQEIGWNSTHLSAIDLLTDITGRYLMQIAKQTKKYAEHSGRTLVCEEDILLGLKDMNVSVSELEEYVQNFEPIPTTRETPYFPEPRTTDLNFLRPGSDEMLTRPIHVHDYMPPMEFKQEEDAERDQEENGEVVLDEEGEEQLPNGEVEEIRVKAEPADEEPMDVDQSTSQNEIMMMPFVLEEPSQVPDVGSELVVTESQVVITEEVEVKTENLSEPENDTAMPMDEPLESEPIVPEPESEEKENGMEEESSDDEIEPGLKAATMFATFKSTKKLGARTENVAIKRIRKLLEEQGHPIREVTSVIVTKDGFISESKPAFLPECKPPPNRDFFETSPVPAEKKKKPPTMKKILEGVKRLEKSGEHSDSGGENEEPGLFGVMDKISKKGGENDGITIPDQNGAVPGVPPSKKKLSKQERKLLHQKKKEKKLKLKGKSKEKQLLKAAKLHATSASKELDPSGSKNKLKIFKKKLKASKLDPSGLAISKKKKKDKKNKSKPKEVKVALSRVEETHPELVSQVPVDTEMIESDEDFSNIPEGKVVPPMHIMNPAAATSADQMPLIPRKKIKKEGRLRPEMFELSPQHQPKKLFKIGKKGLGITGMGHPPLKTKLPKLKRPFDAVGGEDGMPPAKKKRGRPKKIWGGAIGAGPAPAPSAGIVGPSHAGPMSLPAAQLADIGKSLMKEPQLNVMKIRKEHMEIQDVVQRPPMFTTKPPTLSPSKGMLPSLVNADLLKRLPAQPGLIPDHLPVPPVRLPKELSTSISVTPSLTSPQKDMSAMATSSSPRNLASNMCSSVTITRIEMNPQKLPSRYDDSITPGIGPPPGMEGPIKRGKFGKPPPLLQIPVHTEIESGLTITPIVMGGSSAAAGASSSSGGGGGAAHSGGNKEHRYDHPLPPPPPLQERPQKHSMLAKLDEELSSATSTSSVSSKDQRKKDKEKRKELKKEKKKKAKDKSKDKSEKKKKKKDKSGESTSATSDAGEHPVPIIPKLTLKIGGHSNTATPVDSPNPPQVYHEPPIPGPIPAPKKLTFKGLHQEPEAAPKIPKQPKMPSLTFAPPPQEEEDLQVARFAPLVTRPQKPARAAKTHAAAAVAAIGMGASLMRNQDIVQFPSMRDSGGGDAGNRRGRGRPPKGNMPMPAASPVEKVATPSSSKQGKSSLTVLETETVGCIIDEQGNKIWICPACGRQDDGSPMIGCDKCDDWYHFTCVGIKEEPGEEEQWYCQRCKKKQKEGKQKKGRK